MAARRREGRVKDGGATMSCTYIRCSAEKQMGREGRGTLIQAELPACGDALPFPLWREHADGVSGSAV